MTNPKHPVSQELAELKPCPFCGGRSTLIRPLGEWLADPDDKGRSYGPDRYRVVCGGLYETPIRDCPGRGAYDTEVEAIAAWNTRPIPTAPQSRDGLVEALRIIAMPGTGPAETINDNNRRIAANALEALRTSSGEATEPSAPLSDEAGIERGLREALRTIYIEANETIPPDGKNAAFGALRHIGSIALAALSASIPSTAPEGEQP